MQNIMGTRGNCDQNNSKTKKQRKAIILDEKLEVIKRYECNERTVDIQTEISEPTLTHCGPDMSIDVFRTRYVWNTLYLALAPHFLISLRRKCLSFVVMKIKHAVLSSFTMDRPGMSCKTKGSLGEQ
jgi:hypothetical protein